MFRTKHGDFLWITVDFLKKTARSCVDELTEERAGRRISVKQWTAGGAYDQ